MWLPLVVLVAAGALGVAAWAGWRALRDRPVVLRQLLAAGVVEALLLVQLVLGGVLQVTGTPPADVATWWGYAVTTLLLLPVAAAWAFAERSRWSSVVLLVAAVTVAFLQLRLHQVWLGT